MLFFMSIYEHVKVEIGNKNINGIVQGNRCLVCDMKIPSFWWSKM